MTSTPIGPGDVLAGRYRLEDLLADHGGGHFWRANDEILARSVAVHVIPVSDPRAGALLDAARTSATVTDGHILRVLDAAEENGAVYVVNEWGSGVSLDLMIDGTTLPPRRAAWLIKEVAEAIQTAHTHGVAHGRLLPENVLVNEAGSVKLIGFVVDAVLNGRQGEWGGQEISDHESDVINLASLLYAALVGRWPGTEGTSVPAAPEEHNRVLRPRQVKAGIPRQLDAICQRVLDRGADAHVVPIESAQEITAALIDYLGDPSVSGDVPRSPFETWDREASSPTPSYEDAATGELRAPAPDPLDEATQTFQAEHLRDGPATTPPAGPPAVPPAVPPAGAQPSAESGAPADDPQDPEATALGAPVFYDDDAGVGWVGEPSRRGIPGSETPRAPVEPLHEFEGEKPLFAPERPGGRRPKPSSTTTPTPAPPPASTPTPAPGQPGFWPWSGDDPAATGEPWEEQWEEDNSRGWLRLAAILGACLVLLVAIVFAFNYGRDSGGTPSSTPTAGESSGSPTPTVVKIASADDFDPLANPPEENSDLAPLAIDGDPSTGWYTSTYQGNPKLGLLKDGVGLLLDLGKEQKVSEVDLRLVGSPSNVDILAAAQGASAPTSTDGLDRVARKRKAGERTTLTLDKPVVTRYLVVWFTSLPPANGGYRGEIAEVRVLS